MLYQVFDAVRCHVLHRCCWKLIPPPAAFAICDGKPRWYYWCLECCWLRTTRLDLWEL